MVTINVLGRDVITANPCGASGICWHLRIRVAFMHSMNWVQLLLLTATGMFQGHPEKMKVWSLTKTTVSDYGLEDVLGSPVF